MMDSQGRGANVTRTVYGMAVRQIRRAPPRITAITRDRNAHPHTARRDLPKIPLAHGRSLSRHP